MAVNRRAAILIAGGIALAGPMLVLWPKRGGQVPAAAPAPVIQVAPGRQPERLYARQIFAPDRSAAAAALPPDAPRLVGIVGRIGRDAVALVELPQGSARTIAPGESVDGWTLIALTVETALFARGTARIRVPLPVDDEEMEPAPAEAGADDQ